MHSFIMLERIHLNQRQQQCYHLNSLLDEQKAIARTNVCPSKKKTKNHKIQNIALKGYQIKKKYWHPGCATIKNSTKINLKHM